MIPWNHLALIISVLANVPPDDAFMRYEIELGGIPGQLPDDKTRRCHFAHTC